MALATALAGAALNRLGSRYCLRSDSQLARNNADNRRLTAYLTENYTGLMDWLDRKVH